MPMLLNITILILSLVLINFLLLFLSCNKTKNTKKVSKQPVILRPEFTLDLDSKNLAATGS